MIQQIQKIAGINILEFIKSFYTRTFLKKFHIIDSEQLSVTDIKKTARYMLAHQSYFFLLDTNIKCTLYEAIEQLNNMMDSRIKKNYSHKIDMNSISIAYEVDFPPEMVMLADENKIINSNISKLSELLRFLRFNRYGKLAYKYTVLVNDKENQYRDLITNVLQQLFYLKLLIQVLPQSHYGKSKERCISKQNVQQVSANMIKFTLIGTKKAGKSMLINCLLGDEYSVTSLELPTPNQITYSMNQESKDISLEYDKQIIKFPNVAKLKEFMKREFQKANRAAVSLPTMHIKIAAFPEEMENFEVIDTPGPNFAAAYEHAQITYDSIEHADACIFVINYSSHLTHDEVELFDRVYQYFAKQDRLSSIIIAINQLDERYASEVDKASNRIIDYIKNKLNALGYENILVVGISALLYFNLIKAEKIAEKNKLTLSRNSLQHLKQQYRRNPSIMSCLTFIDYSLENLEDFHGIKKPSVDMLYDASGIYG